LGGETPSLLAALRFTRRARYSIMSTFFQSLTGIAIAAVAVVLVLGVLNMMRGSSPNRSQLLMRLRVILQFTAIVVMMAALYFSRH
jgi:hypothetical protein